MIYFTETQRFRQWWIWLLIILIAGLQVKKLVYGYNQIHNTSLMVSSLIILSIILLFLFSKLITTISDKGISYQFLPFNFSEKLIPWDHIEKAFIRKYKPIVEYGGWGYRLGIFGYGRALNVSGNTGLQLVLKNGKRFLIGTRKPEELLKALNEINARNQKNYGIA